MFIILALILFAANPAFAINKVAEGYRINSTNSATIDAAGKCRVVTNNSSANQFVATYTQGEWWSFITSPPGGISNSVCSITADYTTSAQLTLPAGATGTSVAGAGAIWTSSAWVQLTASTATAIVLTGIAGGVRS
jgi:hypothetical protein